MLRHGRHTLTLKIAGVGDNRRQRLQLVQGRRGVGHFGLLGLRLVAHSARMELGLGL